MRERVQERTEAPGRAPMAPPPLRMPEGGVPPTGVHLPRRRRVSWGVLLLLAAAAIGGAAGWWFWMRPVAVRLGHPWRGPALEAVYATGVMEAVDSARVGTLVAGRILSLAAEEGDRVRRGQVLAMLDGRQMQQRVEDVRARLLTAEQDLARTRELISRGVRSSQQLEHAVQDRDQAEAAVQLALRQQEEYTVRAPLDGLVMKRPVEPGETVPANATLYEVASTAALRVAADVDERDIPRVRMGARVAIRADAFPERAFAATVTNIRRQGDAGTRSFRVEAALPADTPLLIGMTVDVNVVVAEREQALLVPAAAVRHGAARGGQPGPAWVLRVRDGVARRAPVHTGAVGPQAIEVLQGLAESDSIVAEGVDRVSDGARVREAGAAPP